MPSPATAASNQDRIVLEGARPPARRWGMLVIMLAMVSIGSMGRYAVSPLAPFIIEEFGLSAGEFGLLASSLSLSAVAATMFTGPVIDRRGVRESCLLSALVMGIFPLGFLLPQTYYSAIVLLFLTGVGWAAVTPLTSAGAAEWFPPSERGFAVGFKQAGLPMGAVLAAAILPHVALRFRWQAAIALVGLIILATGAGSYAFYRQGPYLQGQGNRAGAVERGKGRGIAGSIRDMLRDAGMVHLTLLGLGFGTLQMALGSFLVPYFQGLFEMSVVEASGLFGLSQLAGVVARPLIGLVSDKVFRGRRKSTFATLAFCAGATTALLALLPASTSGMLLTVVVLIVGATIAGWAGLFIVMCIERPRPDLAGTASAWASMIGRAGSLIGAPLFGYLVDFTSYRTAWLVFAVGMALLALNFVLRFDERSSVGAAGMEGHTTP